MTKENKPLKSEIKAAKYNKTKAQGIKSVAKENKPSKAEMKPTA